MIFKVQKESVPSIGDCMCSTQSLKALEMAPLALEQSKEADLQKLPVSKSYSHSHSFIMAPGFPGCLSAMTHVCSILQAST